MNGMLGFAKQPFLQGRKHRERLQTSFRPITFAEPSKAPSSYPNWYEKQLSLEKRHLKPPLTGKILDVEATWRLLDTRTHCRWELSRYATTFPLRYKQACTCPLTGCGRRFLQADGPSGIVAHMEEDHFAPEQDPPTCRKHSETVIYSVADWLDHWQHHHRYIICFGMHIQQDLVFDTSTNAKQCLMYAFEIAQRARSSKSADSLNVRTFSER